MTKIEAELKAFCDNLPWLAEQMVHQQMKGIETLAQDLTRQLGLDQMERAAWEKIVAARVRVVTDFENGLTRRCLTLDGKRWGPWVDVVYEGATARVVFE